MSQLRKPVSASSLVVFRILAGVLLCWHMLEYLIPRGAAGNWALQYYVQPPHRFYYPGFSWVEAAPSGILQALLVLACLAGMGVAVGYRYRLSCAIYSLISTYVFLLDRTYYLNHAYLICLIPLLMFFVPANCARSIDAARIPEMRSTTVPRGALWLLRAQFGIVYVYAGLAKINFDWLAGEPIRSMLEIRADHWLVGKFAGSEAAVAALSYGGLLLDLFAVPALLWRRTRVAAVVGLVVFHAINSQIFDIGVFPLLMLAASTLFFPADWAAWALTAEGSTRRRKKLRGKATRAARTAKRKRKSDWPGNRWIAIGLAAFLLAQSLLPFRHWLIPGDVRWTDEGHMYAWRMKLRARRTPLWFTVFDPRTGEGVRIDPSDYIPDDAARALVWDPAMRKDFGRWAAERVQESTGRPTTRVRFDEGLFRLRVTDPASGRTRIVRSYELDLTPAQVRAAAADPELIRQTAHLVADAHEGPRRLEVRAEVWGSLHGRAFQPAVDPDVDLAAESWRWGAQPWIVPLRQKRTPGAAGPPRHDFSVHRRALGLVNSSTTLDDAD